MAHGNKDNYFLFLFYFLIYVMGDSIRALTFNARRTESECADVEWQL